MNGQTEDFLYDPAGFFVRCQRVLDLRVALVTQRRIGKNAFSLFKFRMECALYLAAGVLGKPLVEQILERHELRQALFGVLILGNGDIADLFLREHKLQIIIHHHVFTSKPTEVFGYDAVDFSRFHIAHHPLEAGAVKIGAAPSVVHVLAIDAQAVLGGKLLQDGALGLNADAVAEIFIIAAQAHIQSGAVDFGFRIVRLFHCNILLCVETTHAYNTSTSIIL